MRGWLGIGMGLLLIAALVWIAFFWRRLEKIPENESGPLENSPLIDMERVKSFELLNQKGRVKFEKNDQDLWVISEPEKDAPDPLFFGGMVDVLSELTRQRYVAEAERNNLPQYGLDPALATLTFQFKDTRAKKTLRVGRVNPMMSSLYAWYEDEPEIFLIQPKLRMFIVMGLNELRYRRLIRIKAGDAQEFKIIISDSELRKELGVPETRNLIKQTTAYGPSWFLMDTTGSKDDGGQTEEILRWMELGAISDRVFDITPDQLKKWGLDPPSAYFEIVFPYQTEKILIGKEKEGWIYLFQEKRWVLLGYKKDEILDFLGRDFQVHKLMTDNDVIKFNQIELGYPDGKIFKLIKLDSNFWSIGGEQKNKFQAEKIVWLIEPFITTDYRKIIRERPIPLEKYGLKNPRIKLKYYSGQDLILEIWVGKWDKKQVKCYVYVPNKNILSWYTLDLMEGIPPDASAFLAGEKKN